MAMARSALCRVSRLLSGSSAAAPVMRRRGLETLQAPPLPSLCSSSTLIPRLGPPMRAYKSPAAAAPTGRIPNTQGQQHSRVISTEGMKWAEQKRFLSMESKEQG